MGKFLSKIWNEIYSRFGEIIRFGIVGGIAMAIHYGIYYLLLRLINLNVAFSIGYGVSFMFNFFASSYFTFKVKPTWSRLVKFGTGHGLNYLLQLGVFNFALYLGVFPSLAPIIVFMISVPANFIMIRFAMKKELRRISVRQMAWGCVTLVAISIYMMTIVNSVGFYYPDEHFQIIEFARWKMGVATESTIPWELSCQIRPTLQPVITLLLMRVMEAIGIVNPFHQTLLLRLVMASVMTTAIGCFIRATRDQFPTALRYPYAALSYLLWFIPFLCVRYSSETMSAAFLLFAMAGIVGSRGGGVDGFKNIPAFVTGALLCLSFEFRYQMAFAIAGIALWSIFTGKMRVRDFWATACGFGVVLLLCTLIDSLFYENLVFAPWNYFRENIVHGVASTFGTAPWYAYFPMVINGATPLVGFVMIAAIAVALFLHPKSPVTWAVVCFIIGHAAVAHKELRFLFPIVFFMPLFIMWLVDVLTRHFKDCCRSPVRYAFIFIVGLFIIVNTGGLLIESVKSPRYGRSSMLAYLHESDSNERMICCRQHNIFKVSSLLKLEYHRRDNMEVDEDIDDYLLGSQSIGNRDVVVLNRGDVWRLERAAGMGLQEVFASVPEWVDYLNRFYKIYNPSEVKVALRLPAE